MNLNSYPDLEPFAKVSDAIAFLSEEMAAGDYTCIELEDMAHRHLLTTEEAQIGVQAIADLIYEQYGHMPGGSLLGALAAQGTIDTHRFFEVDAERRKFVGLRQSFLSRVIERLQAKGQ